MNVQEFEKRKKDHLELSLKPENQALGFSGLDFITLEHEALPDLDFSEISLETKLLGKKLKTPLYVNSMTAGHQDAIALNVLMAEVCQNRGWMMGVGSQRRQLHDGETLNEWKVLRKKAKNAVLIGNLGISQVITSSLTEIQKLVDSIEAQALFVHLNALQECLQKEGTPHFKGGLKALEKLTKELSVPVVVKETGCGFSGKTLKRLKNIGLEAVDISGLGGTHWGRIEGSRAKHSSKQSQASKTFQDWGIGTVQSLINGIKVKPDYQLWASGGVRTGLDAAKLMAMGASAVGFAKPALEAALSGHIGLNEWMEVIEFELKTAMFVTGANNIKKLKKASWKQNSR
jgi:isopentenyl-diphosphate delta-isomerase